MLDRIAFLFGEALQGFRRHGLMSFAAVSTVAVALYLIGGLGYVYFQVDKVAKSLSSRFEIQAFLNDGTSKAQISETAKAIRAIDGVKSAIWIPKERAWEKERAKNPELTIGLDNPYPDALKITLTDLSKFQSVVGSIENAPHVQPEGVMYHDPMQRSMNDIMRMIQWLGLVLGGLLFLTAGMLIYNAIRLTLDNRKREIRIMQLVGASHMTVRVPFLIEGAIQGSIGGVVATTLMWITYLLISRYVEANLTSLNQMGSFALGPIALGLIGAGAAYGAGCSALAIRKPARLRGQAI